MHLLFLSAVNTRKVVSLAPSTNYCRRTQGIKVGSHAPLISVRGEHKEGQEGVLHLCLISVGEHKELR